METRLKLMGPAPETHGLETQACSPLEFRSSFYVPKAKE
jgi:hypothetical protein